MKVDKSLQEVWDWKDKVYQTTKSLSRKEAAEYIHKGAEEFCKKYRLRLKKLHSSRTQETLRPCLRADTHRQMAKADKSNYYFTKVLARGAHT